MRWLTAHATRKEKPAAVSGAGFDGFRDDGQMPLICPTCQPANLQPARG
jgi:hypothetical protein